MLKKNYFILLSLFVLILNLATPLETLAQTYSREWRNSSRSLSRKINNLDNKKVVNLAVPILFGVTPDNLSKNFGDPRSGGRKHEGLDIMAPLGAPIVSPTEAVVIRTGVGDSAGNYVYTANPGGETLAYMHLDSIADIDEGDELEEGDLIGYVGNTGNASGGVTHLHFEIQNDRDATDPYPRLTRIFPLADKIEYLESILDDVDNKKKLAENMVLLYRKELILAQTLNIALPSPITTALTNKIVVGATSVTRTLRLGSQGEDVKIIQTNLGVPADGSFGPKTKSALVAFQISKDLTADGVFGSITRVALLGSSGKYPAGCTPSTIYSATTGIKCIPVL